MLDDGLVLKGNELYLVGKTRTDGSRERAAGLYVRDTRHLSVFNLTLNEVRPERLSIRQEAAASATVISTNPLMQLRDGSTIYPQQLLVERRSHLDRALIVDVTLQSFARRTLEFTLNLEFACDFRDLFDIRGFPRAERGQILEPEMREHGFCLGYTGVDGVYASTEVTVDRDARLTTVQPSTPAHAQSFARLPSMSAFGSEISRTPPPVTTAGFEVRLEPGEVWSLRCTVSPRPAGGASVKPLASLPERATVSTDYEPLNRALVRSQLDLDALFTGFPDGALPAAGIPWFVAPFGRDSAIASLQTLHLTPERAISTLRTLAALQGERVVLEREEEPGKILHEMRYGEMARTHEVPHRPYYGSIDATPLFVWLFAEVVAWTGDRTLFDELLPHAERAIRWIRDYGDLDGDGLVEYRNDALGTGKITNQVWKDSGDSLNHADGGEVGGPIAAVEVQGYVYSAYRRLADVVRVFGDHTRADELQASAEHVRDTVERQFWMEEAGFYAQALDGSKRRAEALSSNAGQLLLSGLPSPERAARVIATLGGRSFDSGWGIRTLATSMPTYNPMSYHNGSIWPHDNSMIGAGFCQYGEFDACHRVMAELNEAANRDPIARLPELYCGFAREFLIDESPVGYPVSCSPQAWSAGALPFLSRVLCGLNVDLEARELIVAAHFPDWLTRVSYADLEVLGSRGSLTIQRSGDTYAVESSGLPVRFLTLN